MIYGLNVQKKVDNANMIYVFYINHMELAKFRVIYNDIYRRIVSGELQEGEKLPPEKELAAQYCVAVPTLRQALSLLRKEGFVVSRRYHGTVISSPERALIPVSAEKENRIIGLVVPTHLHSLSHPVFSRLVDGIEGVLTEQGYSLEAVVSNPASQGAEAHFANTIRGSKALGWLVPALISKAANQLLCSMKCSKVLMHFKDDKLSPHFFEVDYQSILFSIFEHLNQNGYKNAWLLYPRGLGHMTAETLKVSSGFGRELGIKVSLLEVSGFEKEAGRNGVQKILSNDPGADAFVCLDDELAGGVLEGMSIAGLSSPELGVVGGGDFPLSSLIQPTLTTVSYPYYQVGREAAQLLMNLIAGVPNEPAHRRFVPKLIVRGSSVRGVSLKELAGQ